MNMEPKYIDELVNSCESQNEYVRKLVYKCIKYFERYEMIETIFMNEIKRKYDYIINVLLKIINPQIMIKIIKSNEDEIFKYILKFKKLITIELFLDIIITNCDNDYLNSIMEKKYTYKPEYDSFPTHMSFLNIIIYHTDKYNNKKKISQEYITKILLKTKNISHYLEINEFRHHWTNYMHTILFYDDKYFNQIIKHLIDLTEKASFYELAKIKIYYDKSNIETKLNLFEYTIVKLNDEHRIDRCSKLTEFIINELSDDYVNFVLNECDLNLIVSNSLKSYFWRNKKNEIFNSIWRDSFFEHIEPTKLVKVSYYETSILYEALCNKNIEFVKKILLNETITKQINFDIKYNHFPEYSGVHTFISLVLYYVDFFNCAKIKSELVDVLNICFNNFKNVIDFNDSKCLHYIMNNCFDDFFKFNEIIIYDNLNKFNFELIKLEKIDEFKKIKQNNNSTKTFLNDGLYTLCEKNNVKFVKYLIDGYFEFNSIDDINK